MADYFPVLSRAVAGLENNTGETRRAVYERARAAIVRQLRSIEPPLSEDDISRERMNLEEAIRKVEAGAGGGAAPARPAPAPSPSQADAPADPSKASAARPYRPAPPKPDAAAHARAQPPRAPMDGRASSAGGPAKRADGRPIIHAAGETPGAKPKQRSGALVALGALAVIAVGVGAFAAWGPISNALSGGEQKVARTDAAAPGAAEPANTAEDAPDAAAGKSDDRIGQHGGDSPAQRPPPAETAPPQDAARPADPPPAQPAAPAAEQQIARAPDAAAPQQPSPEPSGPLVAQRATLYEEGANQQSGEALTGSVLWSTESVSGGQNQPLETALRGEIDIPARDVKASLVIRRNTDATLPASHTIELQFKLPENFPNAGVSNVPGILMKADESARGAAMAGLSVRVTSGFFLVGLSNVETERTMNEQLMRDRGWIDVPILYDNGRRAVLTLEKGVPGQQAFEEALDAWRRSTAAQSSSDP